MTLQKFDLTEFDLLVHILRNIGPDSLEELAEIFLDLNMSTLDAGMLMKHVYGKRKTVSYCCHVYTVLKNKRAVPDDD